MIEEHAEGTWLRKTTLNKDNKKEYKK